MSSHARSSFCHFGCALLWLVYAALTSDKSSSTFVFSDDSLSQVSSLLVFYTTAVAIAEVVDLSCGDNVYLHCLFP